MVVSICLAIECGCGGICANTVLQTRQSPDGALKAVVFRRECGATTGPSTQVSILPVESPPVPKGVGNTFISDQAGQVVPEVIVGWSGPRTLHVRYAVQLRVFVKKTSQAGVDVEYDPIQSDYAR